MNNKQLPVDENGRMIIFLNKEYFDGEAGKPELQAKVIYAKNGIGILEEYIKFSQIFDEQRVKHKEEPDKMILEVFRICEENGILQNYLKTHRSGVEKIMMTMVSPEYIEKAARKTDTIRGFIEAARLYGAPDDDILNKLITKFDITPVYAQNCLDADWDDDD